MEQLLCDFCRQFVDTLNEGYTRSTVMFAHTRCYLADLKQHEEQIAEHEAEMREMDELGSDRCPPRS